MFFLNIIVRLILIFPIGPFITKILYSISGCSTVCTTVAEAARMVREPIVQAENLRFFFFIFQRRVHTHLTPNIGLDGIMHYRSILYIRVGLNVYRDTVECT